MAKHLVQLIIAGAQVLGKAFSSAVRQEIRMSQEAAKARSSASKGRPGGCHKPQCCMLVECDSVRVMFISLALIVTITIKNYFIVPAPAECIHSVFIIRDDL